VLGGGEAAQHDAARNATALRPARDILRHRPSSRVRPSVRPAG
jgi:hypothetical protein